MNKIIIVEEKAEHIMDKLDKVKHCVEEVIDCFGEAMEEEQEYPEYEDNDYDEEYEIKRRKGRKAARKQMKYGGSMRSRY